MNCVQCCFWMSASRMAVTTEVYGIWNEELAARKMKLDCRMLNIVQKIHILDIILKKSSYRQ